MGAGWENGRYVRRNVFVDLISQSDWHYYEGRHNLGALNSINIPQWCQFWLHRSMFSPFRQP